MLALSRKKNESIMIGADIEITILEIGRDKVKIGINAPNHVTIHRKEIYSQIKLANQEASHISIDSMNEINQLVKKKYNL